VAAAAPPTLDAPPQAPGVTDQQAGPEDQQQGPSAQFIQWQDSGNQLVEQKLNKVAADLKDVAKVLVQSKPNLVPLLQRSLQALSMLMNEIQQGKQQQGKAGMQRSTPEPQSGQEGPDQGAPPPAM